MKRWKKEVLWSLGIGAVAVALILGAAEVGGARFGPCGPSNDAGGFLMFAMLPAIFSLAWLPSGEAWSWLEPILFWPAFILSYALPAWIVIRVLRPKSTQRAYSEEPIQPPQTTTGSSAPDRV